MGESDMPSHKEKSCGTYSNLEYAEFLNRCDLTFFIGPDVRSLQVYPSQNE
jgi:hypothetical protein